MASVVVFSLFYNSLSVSLSFFLSFSSCLSDSSLFHERGTEGWREGKLSKHVKRETDSGRHHMPTFSSRSLPSTFLFLFRFRFLFLSLSFSVSKRIRSLTDNGRHTPHTHTHTYEHKQDDWCRSDSPVGRERRYKRERSQPHSCVRSLVMEISGRVLCLSVHTRRERGRHHFDYKCNRTLLLLPLPLPLYTMVVFWGGKTKVHPFPHFAFSFLLSVPDTHKKEGDHRGAARVAHKHRDTQTFVSVHLRVLNLSV